MPGWAYLVIVGGIMVVIGFIMWGVTNLREKRRYSKRRVLKNKEKEE